MTDQKKSKGPTDFNDLHLLKGLDAVRAQVIDAVDRFKEKAAAAENPINECAGERQQSLGDKTDVAKNELIDRYYYISGLGDVWDSAKGRKLKKGTLKDEVGADAYKAWFESEHRKIIDVAEVNAILSSKAAARLRAKFSADWQAEFVLTDSGEVASNIANARLVLANDEEWQGVLGYCDFSYRIVKRKKPPFENSDAGEWTDTDTDRLRIWLTEKYRFTPKSADALGAVVVAAEANRFHPVREYLSGLEWDREMRVAAWLHRYLGANHNPYHSLVGQMFLIGAVARVMRPPVKLDTVLILEGLQGLGKSTALSILAGEWFTDTPLVLGDKDGFQQMQGVWIIELAELDSFNKAESTRAKQFFGSQVDRYRPSYGRMTQTFPRQCVFAGTTNQDAYLRDATGNRRYWPVMCSKVDAEQLQRDRDQIWAEAFHLYQQGFQWWPSEKEKSLFVVEQEERFESDVWEELIERWLRGHTRERVLISELMEEALGMQAAQMKPPEQKRVGQIMAHLGWHKVRARVEGGRETGYTRPEGWKTEGEKAHDSDSAGF